MKERGITDGLTMNQLAERNAEHVTTIAALEARCAALAAEGAGLKHAMAVTLEHVSVTDADQAGVAAMIINDALHHSETPATDAFLAEVRAQGVEMFSEKFGGGTLLSNMVKEVAADFAAKLRKGVAQ
ncbi:hypothetical protein C2J41_17855 [Salmonella enterica]|nr:hypothetical protein [Salmonella enterica]